MTALTTKATVPHNFYFGNSKREISEDDLSSDSLVSRVQYARAMVKDRHDIIRKWLSKVAEHAESQAVIAELLGLSTPQMNKTLNGGRKLQADELLIVAAYYDVELPRIPGHGQARIKDKSNDNVRSGPTFADDDDDELWQIAERKVEELEVKNGIRFTNEEYIDHIVKLYDTLSRRKGGKTT